MCITNARLVVGAVHDVIEGDRGYCILYSLDNESFLNRIADSFYIVFIQKLIEN